MIKILNILNEVWNSKQSTYKSGSDTFEKLKENSEEVIKKIDALDTDLKTILEPIRQVPYVVLHDATQYFDKHFGTKALGSLIEEPGHEPRPAHIKHITKILKEKKAKALMSEPLVSSAWIRRLTEDGQTTVGTLDYIGLDLTADDEAYFKMMRALAGEMVRVLAK
jgi:zinc transport system substrate-binding protein